MTDEIAERHQEETIYFDDLRTVARVECRACRQKWPCDVAQLLALAAPRAAPSPALTREALARAIQHVETPVGTIYPPIEPFLTRAERILALLAGDKAEAPAPAEGMFDASDIVEGRRTNP
jgi:hypothetical protein